MILNITPGIEKDNLPLASIKYKDTDNSSKQSKVNSAIQGKNTTATTTTLSKKNIRITSILATT
jgi:hypothetical protein